MRFTQLFTTDESERAVSPVIGVILMVAITVILAAVIGTFVLGLGDQVQQTSPNAQWDWDQNSSNALEITHEGGDSVTATNLEVTGGSNLGTSPACASANAHNNWTSSTVTAGTSCLAVNGSVTHSEPASGTYRLIWTAEGGGSSSTLSTYEAN
ncbi:type IV pilin N-terminal domain-containing protein [Natronomonas gomsonensis]|uniref:type IV pilin n=1 Tax=Natronomonas gomsonensis TaxID=1046043 RepID=UPI0015BF4266|nr:type IV pilin N-terminal domain-containing protein [Natronomonas gomsonensis]